MADVPSAATGLDGATYPAHWEADVVLADGGLMHVRPIRPSDGELMARFHERQSPESIYFRFFSPRPRLSARDVERFTRLDYTDRMAFVGIIGEEMVAVARYDRLPARDDAEVAFFVDDAHPRRGIATVLLEYLAAAARDVGITGFNAQVLPQNRRMLAVFQQAGFAVTSRFSDGVVEVELAIEPSERSLEAMDLRANSAEARSVARILAPRSVAVIGASRDATGIGNVVFRRLLQGGFQGPVYPVNPEAATVASVRAYASILDIPDDIDLAVIVVPVDQVADVVEACGRKRVHGLVVMSAGFGEAGPAGAALERQLVERARGLGMRLIGPNTMGVINTAPGVRLHASFTAVTPAPGRIGVSSQSGTIGAAVLDELGRHGLGVSSFVATGNTADVSGNDVLQYWEQDERTDVVVLYLESFGNPRNFGRIARRMSRHTPIVAVKSGRAALAPSSRPGRDDGDGPQADPAGWPSDVTFDALLRQTGVVRVDTIDELVDVTRVLAHQPLPPGRRLAVVTNFWGPAVLAADACADAGLELATLADATRAALATALPVGARAENPVGLTAGAGPHGYEAALELVLADPGVDAVLVLHAPAIPSRTAEVARAVAEVAGTAGGKPVVASFLGPHQPGDVDGLASVPAFGFPEMAVRALGRVARYAAWRAQPAGELATFPDTMADSASALASRLLAGHDGGVWLDPADAHALLATFGVDAVTQELAPSLPEVLEAAGRIGYPVALKAFGIDRPARTEAGGVAVDIHGDRDLSATYRRMLELHGAAMQPALVQAMGPSGVNVAIAMHQHPRLGSIFTVGPSEGHAELRILPLTDLDAQGLAAAVPDLDPAAQAALADLLERLSALAEAVPEMAQARLDPVLVSPAGAVPTDLRIHLAPWHHEPDPAVRRLR